jgi:hypothetical protein
MKRIVLALLLFCVEGAAAQSTAFLYQGKLADNGNPANGNYELQFKLFDTSSVGTGTQQGGTLLRDPVAVSVGVFAVTLDFGANVFDGNPRFLEIAVRPDGSAVQYSTISPRQPILSSPYSIQTLNAQRLGGLPADRYLASNVGGNYLIGVANPLFGKLHVEGGTSTAVYGTSSSAEGLYGTSGSGRGVHGYSTSSIGVYGHSADFEGVRGETGAINHGAVVGLHLGGGIGVFGSSTGAGVQGSSDAGKGVIGTSGTGTGVYGSTQGTGVTTPGVHGVALTSGGIGVIGEANNGTSIGVFGGSSSPTGFGIYAKNLNGGRAFYAEGPVTQANNAGGLPKALIEGSSWTPSGQIWKCYNGVTGGANANCGFTLTRVDTGIARIDLGFPITNRYFIVSAEYDSGFNAASNNIGANYRVYNSTSLEVFTFETNSVNTVDANFTLVVF